MICQRAPIPQAEPTLPPIKISTEALIHFKHDYRDYLRTKLEVVNLLLLRFAVVEGVTMEELTDLYQAAKEGHL